ncbi:glutamine-hydrolyzing GMP synthase [Rickettsiella endosymbiont of Dermanyssus gallinae]|uniref:glutamine-hydrolyzing GMP synthase n=1 Tax=Rickettsiella endosymbiont of Dermanyssus gallinae TaxID=2856608 RepID=UPI001C532C13|nr:glutamine-hydrolyzing GMP synthase [Rickettsiella endosymbiont of Dermanyssus gallinae]
MTIPKERILILDFGSQYTPLIARRIREQHVYCEIHPYDMPESEIKAFSPKGIILSGGPETVTLESTPRAPKIVFELGCPVLGICYGMQTMAEQLGGNVVACSHREFGYAHAQITEPTELLKGITDKEGNPYLDVWMSHGDHVEQVPPEFIVVLNTPNTPIAGMADPKRNFYGLQFHPEVTHTQQGEEILKRFVDKICDCRPSWTAHNILEHEVAEIKQRVGQEKVLLALSGGVDSTVLAALLHKAIGKQLLCVFVNTGLLRTTDKDSAIQALADDMNISVVKIDASDRFLKALVGITDPEEKRKAIGNLFVEIFETESTKHADIAWLAQGTIYSDVIESAGTSTQKAHAIKSHHNVGGLPDTLKLRLLEPLRELFKDEVCELGLELGLPPELVYKHPFPGPGLAIRVLGEVTPKNVDLVRKADVILQEELRKHNHYDKVSQAFCVFLPVKSVGVIGDARQYAPIIAIRAIETIDFMTARWAHLPYALLETISNRIINEVAGISRVVYDVSGKPPATIEWE